MELPNNQQVETGEFLRGINMTGNILLIHMNNNWQDFSGGGHNGVASGNAGFVSSSKIGSHAGTFDGNSDFVDISINIPSIITVSAWAKSTAPSNREDMLWCMNNAGIGGPDLWFSNNNIYLNTWDGTGNLICAQPANMDQWHSYIIVISPERTELYVDGNLCGDAVYKNPTKTSMAISSSNGYDWEGQVDEFAIWNRSLSEQEIKDIYQRGAAKLNLSVKSCDDSLCDGESWTNLGNNLTSPQNLSISNNSYFQYKFDFLTDNSSYTPKLYNVSIDYTLLDTTSPQLILNKPEENSNISSQLVNFNFTQIEDYPQDVSCSIYLDDILNQTNLSVQNNTLTNFEISGIPEGLHNWNITCLDGAGNSNESETRIFYVDISGPSLNSLSYSPNETDNIDPGTNLTFNVNISDSRVEVSSVILEYYNSSDWVNETMEDLGNNIYQANITTTTSEANYTYRIWRNDSFGNIAISQNYNFSSLWDCTWTATQSLGEVVGWDENKFIGNITINNTGDVQYSNNNCSLDFRISYDLQEGRIYYDGEYLKNSVLYNLDAKNSQDISINASFLTEVKQEAFYILIEDSRQRSSISTQNSSATLISTTGGPYLYQKVNTQSSYSLYLTPQNISMSSYFRNIMGNGSEVRTAYNVTNNWTLHSSFLSDVPVNYTFDNISNNSLIYNNFNLVFNETNLASMSQGSYNITLYSYGYNSSGDLITQANNQTILSDNVAVTLLCYEDATDGICVSSCGYGVDPDCPAPSTDSGSGGSGGGGGAAGPKTEKSDAVFDLLRGKEQEFILPIQNKLDIYKKDMTITVSGINAEYIQIIPNTIEQIDPKSTRNITVKITAPAYFNQREYVLLFTIKGRMVGNSSSDFIETKRVTLHITEYTKREASDMIEDSIKWVEEMNKSGMILKDVQILLNQSQEHYEKYDYLSLKKSYEELKVIYESAFESLDIINELNEGITKSENYGLNVIETKKILYTAETAYKRGDYLLALERLNEAKLTYALETKGEFNLAYTIKNKPLESLGVLAAVIAVSSVSSFAFRRRMYKRKLKLLSEEEKLLLELMKAIQIETFEKNKLSMNEYQQAMSQYEEKLSEVISDRIKIETKLSNMFKMKGKTKALEQEKKRLTDLIKQTQEDYLNKGKIETRVYENMLKIYATRLSEVEEEIAVIDAKAEFKMERRIRKD